MNEDFVTQEEQQTDAPAKASQAWLVIIGAFLLGSVLGGAIAGRLFLDKGAVVATEYRESAAPYYTLGDPTAPVRIVEYSDFQCPFCREYATSVLPDLKEKYIDTGQVFYEFRDYPITALHPFAYRLHEASACAGAVGGRDAYWKAHDLFFRDAERFAQESLDAIDAAISAQLDARGLPDVTDCLAADTFAATIQHNVQDGQRMGVSGTPSFFVNDLQISGAQSLEAFEQTIAAALLQANGGSTLPSDGKGRATQTAAAAAIAVSTDGVIALGDPDAPIQVIEYSDFQCPFCRRHTLETMPELNAWIASGDVYYVFKDFPLLSIHPQAQKAHEAARCVRELEGEDQFWLLHEQLFLQQERWGNASLEAHENVLVEMGAEIGVESEALSNCLASGRHSAAVTAEMNEAFGLGLRGTPSFIINGRALIGAQPASVFEEIFVLIKAEAEDDAE